MINNKLLNKNEKAWLETLLDVLFSFEVIGKSEEGRSVERILAIALSLLLNYNEDNTYNKKGDVNEKSD